MRPQAHILTVGNEVLKGTVTNTNAAFLGRELTGLGFEVFGQSSCRDVITEIKQAIDSALRAADLVILSGGLGPTPDDLTREALSEYFDAPLEFSKKQYRFIESIYRARRKKVPAIVRKEALFPKGSVPLFNRVGIALGFLMVRRGKMAVALPGVPLELEKMFHSLVMPALKEHFTNIPKRYPLIVKTVGLSEPAVMKALGKDFFRDPFDFGIYPHPGETTLRLYAEEERVIRRLEALVKKRLAGFIYAFHEYSFFEGLGKFLTQQKRTLALAESCTGGLLASSFTRFPGASKYFRGGAVVYQKDVKAWLGVSSSVLKQGTVSREAAREMAVRARNVFYSDYGIGITGAAGPDSDGGKPPGCVFIAISTPAQTVTFAEQFSGSRYQIQLKSCLKACEHLWKLLGKPAL